MPPKTTPPRKQDRKYWDTMAPKWDAEIFNTLRNDRFRVIRTALERSSRGAHSVADFGCGTGNYLPLLSRLFGDVHGFERSQACVQIARHAFRRDPKIKIHPATLTAVRRYAPFDVALCANVAVHPSARLRAPVMRALGELLAPGGRLILIVPSIESATMVAEAERETLQRRASHKGGDWGADAAPDGVVTIEGMPYKHYEKHELRDLLAGLGYTGIRISKVEYSWASQDVRPGREYRKTLPWDWMAMAMR